MTDLTGSGRGRSNTVVFIVCALLIALVTFAAYLPSLKNGFVNWDDFVYVVDNTGIRSLGPGFFRWASTAVVLSNWHPLTLFSHAVDYAVWGLDSRGHHLTSVIFHAANTFFVAMLAFRLAGGGKAGSKDDETRALITGAVAALLFGLHPLHVESVTWVSERKDVLSSFFFLSSALSYLRYATGRGKTGAYALSLSLFALALLSKPMAVTLPAVLLIIDFYPLGRLFGDKPGPSTARVLMEKLPYFALAAGCVFMTLWAQQKAIMPLQSQPLTIRGVVALRALSFYAFKMLVPTGLVPFYPLPGTKELYGTQLAASAIFFVAVTAFCVATVRKKRAYSAVWLYYLVTLSPVIGIIQVGEQAAADRYTYLPSIAPFILAGAGVALLAKAAGPKGGKAVLGGAAVIIIVLAFLTTAQQRVWKDSVSLWTHEIEYYPASVTPAYYDRALAYDQMGESAKALADYSSAVAVDPADGSAYQNRAVLEAKLGRNAAALRDFDSALKARPPASGTASIYLNRGVLYLGLGRLEEAVADFTTAMGKDPDNPDYYVNRGVAYGQLGELGKAVSDFNAAIRLAPENPKGYMNRGLAYMMAGQTALAIEDFNSAVSLDPKDAKAYYNLGTAYKKSGDAELASKYFKKAAELGFK